MAACAAGVNLALYKSVVFGISALYAGVAGALGTIRMDFIAPDSFTFWLSVLLLIGAVAGGVRSVPGAVLGGLFIQFLPKFADLISKDLSHVVYGVVLIVAVWVMPTGAVGLIGAIGARVNRGSHLRARIEGSEPRAPG
jgi:branched-chain amino acid transport system permease protein